MLPAIVAALCLGQALSWSARLATYVEGVHSFNSWLEASAKSVGISHEVNEQDEKMTVGDYCAKRWTGTKTRCAKLCKQNLVSLNGRLVYATQSISLGDILEIRSLPEAALPSLDLPLIHRIIDYANHLIHTIPPSLPDSIEIDPFVVFEDDHCAVVLKPAGTHTLSWANTMKRQQLTFDAILPLLLKPSPLSDCLSRPLPCHRLDARVSGCLVVAKTVSALANIAAQFEKRRVHKLYQAVLCGDLDAALLGQPHHVGDSSLTTTPCYALSQPIDGADALTLVSRPIRRVECPKNGFLSLAELSPVTGRRHQLRRHCASVLGLPIVGDDLFDTDADSVRRGEGLFLSCTAVSFEHPGNSGGEGIGARYGNGDGRVSVAIPAPSKFSRILERAASGAAYAKAQGQGQGQGDDGQR